MDFILTHFAFVSDPTAWIALLTLIVLEIVLGIDNLIFISILTNKLPENQRVKARRVGIAMRFGDILGEQLPPAPPIPSGDSTVGTQVPRATVPTPVDTPTP